ncbi:hypothetical protein PG993_015296 [Apiospora rasikravindrae]|uniref:Uncharacterized protein n=1 Tax=Apiospora rasikravindrae TaxID=990691 RepID=A0ABR1RQK2_9PEZI
MELDTVGSLVTALVSTYDDGLECYTRWQRKKWQANHYQGHSRSRVCDSGSCGLSTSLMVSASRLRQAYDSGVDVLGDAFSTGDKQCHETLRATLELLQVHVKTLHSAAGLDNAPLGLFEMIRASEAARMSSLRALAEQYQRVAVGRLVPRELPIRQPPSRRPSVMSSSPDAADAKGNSAPQLPVFNNGAERSLINGTGGDGQEGGQWESEQEEDEGAGDDEEGDVEDVAAMSNTASQHTGRSSESPLQSWPLSPPPTPKVVPPDDLQSTCTSEFGSRPRASVFCVFCPEAMKYQVDLQKVMPLSSSSSDSRRRQKDNTCCSRCGYRWERSDKGAGDDDGGDGSSKYPIFFSPNNSNSTKKATTTVKDGFQLTPRFLGKSHCGTGGFGCVLCTSSGKTDVYESVESLRDHINMSHDKWQMLHERDMVNR